MPARTSCAFAMTRRSTRFECERARRTLSWSERADGLNPLPGDPVVVGIRAIFALASVLALAACDDKPNKNFEQSVKDSQAANAGDRYASLESSMPRQSNYARQKKEVQRDYAEGQAGTFRATYDSLLSQLKKDKTIDTAGPLFKSCIPAFAAASAYESHNGDPGAVASARDRSIAALKACRTAAKAAGDNGALYARFASTGIVMIGAKAVGQGADEPGLKIWREGEELVAKDKPGFQINLKSFRGY